MILGAIAGDVIGSVFERTNIKSIDFPLFSELSSFTDDSVLTVATMDRLLLADNCNYTQAYHYYGNAYPNRGYGGRFREWLQNLFPMPYDSNGNGCAMRISPIGWAYDTVEDIMIQARLSAEVTHNHPEGIKGAQAIALAVYYARTSTSKDAIKAYIETIFGYDLNRTIDDIRKTYTFDASCPGTVPEAIIAFLEGTDYESTIRLAISIGGDSDTIACMAGSIAEAFYGGVPTEIADVVLSKLNPEIIEVVTKFSEKYERR